ncbi:MAG: hypothetical protein KAQ91_06295 [Methylococcales bacterium]|nr:hypothetical protein [Methylococcales bacterium]
MRFLSTVFVFIMCALLLGCSKGSEINGRSLKTANRSVSMIKDRLPTEQRIEFEVSYWTLRDSIKNKDEFLDAVDGKSADELIILGKEVFENRKNAGFKNYDQYNSWDQMIAKFTQERIDQNKHKKTDSRDKNNSVLYKL